MRITSLQPYQRPRGAGRFANLSPDQRAAAEAHYQRLCARWGDDLPPWRRAILAGRAKDLVLRPRDAAWGRRLRKARQRQPAPAVVSASTPRGSPPQPSISTPPQDAGVSTRVHLNKVASSVNTSDEARYRTRAQMASPQPAQVVSSPPEPQLASSPPGATTPTSPSLHAVRLDVRGLTARGADGQDSAQRILRDLDHRAFGENLHFSIAVPGKDLPPAWAWRLEVIPVS